MGLPFEIVYTNVNETYPDHLSPVQIAEHLSQLKLLPVNFSEYSNNSIFISCDTLVILEGKILEKPKTQIEAVAMLHQLSGKTHQVISGITVASAQKRITRHSVTEVTFKQLSKNEIQYYVEYYKPYDKAGGYGIQEWIGLIGVVSLHGCYYNVMGLPTQLLAEILTQNFDIHI